jgi:hypothetical protein
MKLAELIAALGGGAFVGWAGKWLVSREERMRAENVALAKVDLEKVRATGETDVTALRADQDTAKIALSMAERERDRYERSVIGHMECLARVEHLQTRLDHIEHEHSQCPERIARLEADLRLLIERVGLVESELPTLHERPSR